LELLNIAPEADRPLDNLKDFFTTMASDLNDLPTISPHGSDFGQYEQILGLASDLYAARGTAPTHL